MHRANRLVLWLVASLARPCDVGRGCEGQRGASFDNRGLHAVVSARGFQVTESISVSQTRPVRETSAGELRGTMVTVVRS
jgi:hypothetical protein